MMKKRMKKNQYKQNIKEQKRMTIILMMMTKKMTPKLAVMLKIPILNNKGNKSFENGCDLHYVGCISVLRGLNAIQKTRLRLVT